MQKSAIFEDFSHFSKDRAWQLGRMGGMDGGNPAAPRQGRRLGNEAVTSHYQPKSLQSQRWSSFSLLLGEL